MYNLLFGVNSLAPLLLKILDLDQPDGKWWTGRFRDIYLNGDGTRIILYTRNGGGNRECWNLWEEDFVEGVSDTEKCDCIGCNMTYRLPKHPHYLYDYDDDFDPTYAYVVFKVPDEYLELTQALATGTDPQTISEKFQLLIDQLKGGDHV